MSARSIFFASCLCVSLNIAAAAHAQGGFGPPQLTLVEMQVGVDGVITEMR